MTGGRSGNESLERLGLDLGPLGSQPSGISVSWWRPLQGEFGYLES